MREYVAEFGVPTFVAGLARRSAQHTRYAVGRIRRDPGTFSYRGEPLEYFWHPYNRTWLGERAIEIPMALHFLQQAGRGTRGLEIGNVLSHYVDIDHRVVDKYEAAPGVENVDVMDVTSDGPLDWVVAISTLEHVGRDEPEPDPDKAVAALRRLRDLLRDAGRLFATVPLGHNPGLDRWLRSSACDALIACTYVRTPRDRWVEVTRPRPSQERYLYELSSAGCLWVGEFGPAR